MRLRAVPSDCYEFRSMESSDPGQWEHSRAPDVPQELESKPMDRGQPIGVASGLATLGEGQRETAETAGGEGAGGSKSMLKAPHPPFSLKMPNGRWESHGTMSLCRSTTRFSPILFPAYHIPQGASLTPYPPYHIPQ